MGFKLDKQLVLVCLHGMFRASFLIARFVCGAGMFVISIFGIVPLFLLGCARSMLRYFLDGPWCVALNFRIMHTGFILKLIPIVFY